MGFAAIAADEPRLNSRNAIEQYSYIWSDELLLPLRQQAEHVTSHVGRQHNNVSL